MQVSFRIYNPERRTLCNKLAKGIYINGNGGSEFPMPSFPSFSVSKHHAFVSRHANNIPRDEQKKSKTQLPKHLRHKSHPSNHPAKSPAANAAHSHSG
jgi:hypothetical protein